RLGRHAQGLREGRQHPRKQLYFARVWRGSHITAACALRIGTEKMPILASGGDRALGLAKFALFLGTLLPMAVIILTITTGLPLQTRGASRQPSSMALEQPIYRAQHWNLF